MAAFSRRKKPADHNRNRASNAHLRGDSCRDLRRSRYGSLDRRDHIDGASGAWDTGISPVNRHSSDGTRYTWASPSRQSRISLTLLGEEGRGAFNRSMQDHRSGGLRRDGINEEKGQAWSI
jgi:hypothetical protein